MKTGKIYKIEGKGQKLNSELTVLLPLLLPLLLLLVSMIRLSIHTRN
jgi:hypothetical protein